MKVKRPLLAVCLLSLVGLFCYMQIWNPPPWTGKLQSVEGKYLDVTGQVYHKEVIARYEEQIEVLYLRACYINGSNRTQISNIKLICEMNSAAGNVRLGERVRIRGVVTLFLHATNPGQFDAADYYLSQGIEGTLQESELLAKGYDADEKRLAYFLYEWRCEGKELLWRLGNVLEERLQRSLLPQDAALMSRMLLARGDAMGKEIKELYQDGGIYHILSISGMHISLLGMGVYRFLRRRSVHLPVAALFGGVLLLAYGSMIGFGISAIRAIGMYLVHLLGDVTGNSYDMLTAMGVMALGMAACNPRILYSAGYVLSFSCVFCIGYFTPAVTKVICGDAMLWQRRRQKGLVESIKARQLKEYCFFKVFQRRNLRGLAGSLSISIFTLPMQLFFFYQVPVYSVCLNLVVIPFVGVLMVLGILLLLFPVFVPAAWGIAWILRLYEWFCRLFLSLPGSVFIAGKPRTWAMIVFYACMVCVVRLLNGFVEAKKNRTAGRESEGAIKMTCRRCGWRLYLATGMIVFAVVMVCCSNRFVTRVTFLDVGQGDCSLLQTKGGINILIDTGGGTSSVGTYRIVPALKALGVNYLDAIVITHPDYDHYCALGTVLAEYGKRCGGVILPGIDRESRDAEFGKVYEVMVSTQAKVPVYFAAAGDVLYERGDERLVCLSPQSGCDAGDSNAYSIVLEFESEKLSVLFTGDVEDEPENVLSNVLADRYIAVSGDAPLQASTTSCMEEQFRILKVAHHGSSGSTGAEFLSVVRPQLAVISCGADNRYGHPHEQTLRRLADAHATVLTTPRCGAVSVEARNGGRIRVRCYTRETPPEK